MASILVIDTGFMQQVASDFLVRTGGHSVQAAKEIETAGQLVRESPPDLVISTFWCSPDGAGQLKDVFPGIPVLITTSFPSAPEIQQSGFDVIGIPFKPEELCAKVAATLETKGRRSATLKERTPAMPPG